VSLLEEGGVGIHRCYEIAAGNGGGSKFGKGIELRGDLPYTDFEPNA
jgi:hypothetical protein